MLELSSEIIENISEINIPLDSLYRKGMSYRREPRKKTPFYIKKACINCIYITLLLLPFITVELYFSDFFTIGIICSIIGTFFVSCTALNYWNAKFWKQRNSRDKKTDNDTWLQKKENDKKDIPYYFSRNVW